MMINITVVIIIIIIITATILFMTFMWGILLLHT